MNAVSPKHALAVFATGLCGCVWNIAGSVGPSVQSTGNGGVEGRGELGLGIGSKDVRGRVACAGGGGYLDYYDSSYGFISPSLGVEGGSEVRGSGELVYSARYLTDRGSWRDGFGVAGQVLFRLWWIPTEDISQSFYIGGRLSGEIIDGPPPEDDSVVASLAVVLRFVWFDTSYGY